MVTRVVFTFDTTALCADQFHAAFNSGKLCPAQLSIFQQNVHRNIETPLKPRFLQSRPPVVRRNPSHNFESEQVQIGLRTRTQ